MSSLKYYLLVVASVLMAAQFVSKSEALLNLSISAGINKDTDVLTQMSQNAIQAFESTSNIPTRIGPIGEVIGILKNGLIESSRLVAVGGNKAFKLITDVVDKDITNKREAKNAIYIGMSDVEEAIYKAGAEIHYALGASNTFFDYKHMDAMNFLVPKIQETGTALFKGMEEAKFFLLQAVDANSAEEKEKCIAAARAAIVSGLEVCNTNTFSGGVKFLNYLASINDASVSQNESSDNVYNTATGSPQITAAIGKLTQGLVGTVSKVLSPIINQLTGGLTQYLQTCDRSSYLITNSFAQAKTLAQSNPQAAINVIEQGIESAKSSLIDGSVDAYFGIGAAGQLSGLSDQFKSLINIAEKSRIDVTKAFDYVGNIVIRGIKTGGPAMDQAFTSAQSYLEASQSLLTGSILNINNLALTGLKPLAPSSGGGLLGLNISL